MKLRTILKIISFILLVFSTMIVLRYPLQYVSGETAQTFASIFGSDEIKFMELAVYLLFAFHMHMLDFKFPKAEFGKFFRYDMGVSVLNFWILMTTFENVALGFLAKTSVEIAAAVTTFFCGWSLCKTLKNHGMTQVGISYLVLSARHIIYMFILLVQLCIIMFGDTKDTSQFFTPTWIAVQWVLLMPILLISRTMLYRGTMKLKVHKHRNREI